MDMLYRIDIEYLLKIKILAEAIDDSLEKSVLEQELIKTSPNPHEPVKYITSLYIETNARKICELIKLLDEKENTRVDRIIEIDPVMIEGYSELVYNPEIGEVDFKEKDLENMQRMGDAIIYGSLEDFISEKCKDIEKKTYIN